MASPIGETTGESILASSALFSGGGFSLSVTPVSDPMAVIAGPDRHHIGSEPGAPNRRRKASPQLHATVPPPSSLEISFSRGRPPCSTRAREHHSGSCRRQASDGAQKPRQAAEESARPGKRRMELKRRRRGDGPWHGDRAQGPWCDRDAARHGAHSPRVAPAVDQQSAHADAAIAIGLARLGAPVSASARRMRQCLLRRRMAMLCES